MVIWMFENMLQDAFFYMCYLNALKIKKRCGHEFCSMKRLR